MMRRDQCFALLARHVRPRDIVVSSYSSAFDWLGVCPDGLTYLAVGAMGLDTSHALGFAIAQPDRRVICLQGDGSLMMNLGSLATYAAEQPRNLVHIVCRNTIYEANGGHPIPNGADLDFCGIARACGLARTHHFSDLATCEATIGVALTEPGPVFVCLDVECGPAPILDYQKLHAPDLIQRFKQKLEETA